MKVLTIFGMQIALFAGFATFIFACPPAAPPAAPPDATDATPTPTPLPSATDATTIDAVAACEALQRVGCVVLSDCARVLTMTQADPRFVHLNLSCIAHALVPNDIRACGVECVNDAGR